MPGILHARAAEASFRYREVPPAPALAPFVAHHWIITWDLRGREPHTQHVLPYPSVNVTFTAGRCRVAGVPRGRFAETLSGAGRVVGVRFRPGGFRPVLGAPVAGITDRFVPVEDVFGAGLADAVLGADDAGAVTALEAALGERLAGAAPSPATAVAEQVAADPAVTRADALAAAHGLSLRALQRLFHDHVGVGPKWVIRRYRLHEAAAAAAGGGLDLPALAAALGYADQAHLTRDFTAIVGVPPARYAREQ
ncbi:helix-turn-helix domain-containing protein [Spirilliplanes yamanashiensis]|uniref:AraC family transcriptional regulator n=1 Tax=Spirilliplanes yamanashiensis TaxID=42233 RepID=A0A8J4DIM3_9ACTN|nr:AraC family transcriptional regulator [Spirilliplanes yamanashiensis]MDP9817441.1 AraC-like DNA-binding protein [Spirilliplanes yamanashiensis]GIJ02906.1 AraC family transcriptional regulator [Spirilliplanes yamanashiensis]